MFADGRQIEQILINLAVNSRDAMPTGGRLVIETASTQLDAAAVAGYASLHPGSYVSVRVSDTGTGIPPEVIDRVFEPFFTTKDTGAGTGLGLATVYGIVTRAGGAVRVESQPGHGTTVTVLLPVTDPPADGGQPPAGEPRRDAGTVLLVEDEPAVREITRRVLDRGGYRVLTAASGHDALALASEAGQIDVLLTDVIMPNMVGQELADRIRAQWPGIRVLFMSGYPKDILSDQGVLEPGLSLIQKPFSAAALLTRLEEIALGREPWPAFAPSNSGGGREAVLSPKITDVRAHAGAPGDSARSQAEVTRGAPGAQEAATAIAATATGGAVPLAPVRRALGPALVALLLLLLVVSSALAVRAYVLYERAGSVASSVVGAGNRLLVGLLNAETGQRGYLLTGKPVYLQPYDVALSTVPADQRLLGSRVSAIPGGRRYFATLGDLVAAKMAELRRTIDLARDGDHAGALRIVDTNEGKHTMDRARRAIGDIQDAAARAGASRRLDLRNKLAASAVLAAVLAITGVGGLVILRRRQRQAERQVARTADLLKRTQEISKTGGWEYDVTSGRVTWTDEVYRIYGLGKTTGPLDPSAAAASYDTASAPVIDAAYKRLIADAEPFDLEARLIRPDGQRLWVHTRGRAEVKDGQVVRATGNLVDITDRKRAEAEVHQLNAELEERVATRTADLLQVNQDLEAFTYSLAHDLRSPLRASSGFSEALLEEYGDRLDDTGREYARRVVAADQRMAGLIDDLLNLAKASRGGLHLEMVDLSAEAADIAAELRRLDPQRRARFSIQTGVCATADRKLVRTVLQNLFDNAWKFTAARDETTIEFGRLTLEESPVCCYVRDNGVGFDPAYGGKIFEPFQRLHSGSEFPGNGIGLASVQRIIERHGGRTWAEGADGQGATVYFTLNPGHAR